ncbi:hypothetical protein [Streptomyces pinistramenti]|uniref:hypothetical protein n=1 Tax=Streptomyces pinistramenti TaxID=2884812 RepID=UPI001D06A909|nr:hypothetical protein [Streptomyces pinistramenti]MCB5909591.1 hypothetical protein [Streptomyces pinistramenti]
MRHDPPGGDGREQAGRERVLERGHGNAWRRGASVVVLAGALALTVAGCGIRGTSVPVDAGGAPARVSCKVADGGKAQDRPDDVRTAVYMVCSSALIPVQRAVARTTAAPTGTERLRAARTLLGALQKTPTPAEEEAGFSTAVPEDLKIAGPRAGDPADTLRLSTSPDDLPSFALAQLACTYGAAPALGRTHTAVLGGPDDDAPRRYPCSTEVLIHPDTAQNGDWGVAVPGKGGPR